MPSLSQRADGGPEEKGLEERRADLVRHDGSVTGATGSVSQEQKGRAFSLQSVWRTLSSVSFLLSPPPPPPLLSLSLSLSSNVKWSKPKVDQTKYVCTCD